MKKVMVILAIALIAVEAYAANLGRRAYFSNSKVSATGKAYATIFDPVSINSLRNVKFGMITAKDKGKVILTENEERISTGPGLATSKRSTGIVRIKGPANHLITVNIPDSYIIGEAGKTARFEPNIPNNGKSTMIKNGEVDLKISGALHLNNESIERGTHRGIYVVQASY